ncbi:nucleic acid-binding protein [Phlegmacium glaucopus]|nr:nucleic acid-binding protein [Phlegmacium glaucopus]
MSFKAAVLTLKSPVKDLVLSVTRDGRELLGENETDTKDILGWIDKMSREDFLAESGLKDLDNLLVPKTYVATNYLTAADVALYGSLHPVFSRLRSSEYYAVPSVTRYFDHIQCRPPIRASAESFGDSFKLLSFDLENAPKTERQTEPPKKKEKAPKEAVPASAQSPVIESTKEASNSSTPVPGEGEKGQRRDKKEKQKAVAAEPGNSKGPTSKKGNVAKPLAADEGEPVPSMIDLRVGHIVDVIKHPDADGLYVEQIDLGEEAGPRTVVSGLVNYIPIEQMRDKYLVAVCNLKPASMRGVKSFAMVLCATSKEGKEGGIELIQPPADSKPGDRVYFEGEEFESAIPLAQLNPKKKIFETIQPGFITLESREAAWVNPITNSVHKIRTKGGVCVAPTLIGASLS